MKSETMKEIYFAGGCFWGTDHFFKQVRGVITTEPGYVNGHTNKPIYEEVNTDTTGYAEAVKVIYDPKEVRLELLIKLFFETIDPTSLNKQGNDVGTRYRTGVYYTNAKDKAVTDAFFNKIERMYFRPIVVERKPLEVFYPAEDWHRDYLIRNPNGYCHIEPHLFAYASKANPKKPRYKRESQSFLKKKLTPLQYAVTQKKATEQPFDNLYWNENRKGVYVDITTGEPLFLSSDKYDSGFGWPSFTRPIDDSLIIEKPHKSGGKTRVEVRSKTGNSHLGHLFNDGPLHKGGLRYSINSASLRFIPKEDMEKEGYGIYLFLFME